MKRVPKVSMTRYAGFVSAYHHPDNHFSLKDHFVRPSDNDWQFLAHLCKFELMGLGHERGCRDSQAVYETAYQYSIDSFFCNVLQLLRQSIGMKGASFNINFNLLRTQDTALASLLVSLSLHECVTNSSDRKTHLQSKVIYGSVDLVSIHLLQWRSGVIMQAHRG